MISVPASILSAVFWPASNKICSIGFCPTRKLEKKRRKGIEIKREGEGDIERGSERIGIDEVRERKKKRK